jgi:hypothetical protein
LCTSLCHGSSGITPFLLEFSAIVGSNRVYYDQANSMFFYGHRQLVTQDMLLRFEVWGLNTKDSRERWLFVGRQAG